MKLNKMSGREFARALREGRGSALLQVARYGLSGRRKVFLAALQENHYFCSIEGGDCGNGTHNQERCQWLLSLLDIAGETRSISESLEKLLNDQKWQTKASDDALAQVAVFCAGLFERGYPSFKPILFKLAGSERIRRNPEIIAAALIKVAHSQGFDMLVELLARSSAYAWQYGEVYRAACSVMGDEKEVDSYIAERSAVNRDFAKFSYEAKWALRPGILSILNSACSNSRPTFQDVVDRIELDKFASCDFGQYGRFGEIAGMTELERIQERIENEVDKRKLCNYLAIFARADLPAVSQKVLSLLENSDRKVRYAALLVLCRLKKDPLIRAKAMKFLLSNVVQQIEFALRLLVKNSQDGDRVVIEKALQAVKSEHDRHRICECLLELASADRRSFLPLMYRVVEMSPCPTCRRKAMVFLAQHDGVPSSYFVEAQWDFDPELRVLAAQRASAFYMLSGRKKGGKVIMQSR